MNLCDEDDIKNDYLSEEDVKVIVQNTNSNYKAIISHCVSNSNDKTLGYMSDYWLLKAHVQNENGEIKVLNYFIKAFPKDNIAKGELGKSLKIYDKELNFYNVIKNEIYSEDIRAWSPKFIGTIKGDPIFEDLNALHFKMRNKFETFDQQHTFQALQTIARFHASSFIYEEKKTKETQCNWRIRDHYGEYLDKGGYFISSPWYIQCMYGALDVLQTYSKYANDRNTFDAIKTRWFNVWKTAAELSDSTVHRQVICHRDLWNNNLMFHYKNVGGKLIPDDCVMVDFQAVSCQAPSADVMLLLYCNLEPDYREKNINLFLNYYYDQLKLILDRHGMNTENILSRQNLFESADEQRLWGLVASACLIPMVLVKEELMSEILDDTNKYKDIMTINKGSFIHEMIAHSESYKNKILSIFEEVIERYCL